MVSLTDMWPACGSDPNKRPREFVKHDYANEFIEGLRRFTKGAI